MRAWVLILKTVIFSILSLSLLFAFFSWVLYPVFLPKEYTKRLDKG